VQSRSAYHTQGPDIGAARKNVLTRSIPIQILPGLNGVFGGAILRNYAPLTDPDIDAALAYAAELKREGTVDLPLEIKA